jgi:hypothetical protein
MAKTAPKSAAPRKALGEKSAASLNKKPKAADPIEDAPLKKVKKTIAKAKPDPKPKPVKASAGAPPDFVSEITLPGEETVYSLFHQ